MGLNTYARVFADITVITCMLGYCVARQLQTHLRECSYFALNIVFVLH